MLKNGLFKKPKSVLENEILWDLEIWMEHAIFTRRLDLVLINKKKRIYHPVDFAILADSRVKIKASKKIDKYLDLARELKRLWNMKIMVIPNIVGAIGTTWKKSLIKRMGELEIRRRIETIQTTAFKMSKNT